MFNYLLVPTLSTPPTRSGRGPAADWQSFVRFARLGLLLLGLLVIAGNLGCTPRTLVKKNPGPNDAGVRYYRPKPYLMVKPAVDRNGNPLAGYVSIETTMLPDYNEEYSIHIRPGLGNNKTSITLDDGWNLTKLNVEVDSQTDEKIRAFAEVAKGIPTGGLGMGGDLRVDVKGVNVPMGLYESVISHDGCQKRLLGFRYIGFLPFSHGPVEGSGGLPYEDTLLYGLVFDKEANVMVFKLLHEISENAQPQREVFELNSGSGIGRTTGLENEDVNELLEDNPPRRPRER
jgi:hypothetical protein